ncbi:DNA polymerase I [Mycobacterium phage Rosebush]|uniref:DNA polymerase n=1 Tax=Mycobacterium phage Rosebush TaxID=205874 RepID=Q856X8_9CAUD|nr:gp56 [Mycobacterium phage Rosebush]AAN01898.1 DNA polymerase I [Mycobacterium phage Rosebush]
MTITITYEPVPDTSWLHTGLNCHMHTGRNALEVVAAMPSGIPVAADIETPGLDRNFEINCLTAAWIGWDGTIESVLLDPIRWPAHRAAARDVFARASKLVFHNASFDVPPLWHHGLIDAGEIRKIADTVLLARFAYPDSYGPPLPRKTLEACAVHLLGLVDVAGGMERAFKAAGFKTIQDGYENMNIDAPIYRQGAMADTVATLLLEPVLRRKCVEWTTSHPFAEFGATTEAEALEVLEVQEIAHWVMLQRSARGLAVDRDYLDEYREREHDKRLEHAAFLAQYDLEGGTGKGPALVKWLEARGELPSDWPRTPKGAPSAAKEHLETLDHPVAAAQRALAQSDKVLGYLEKVSRQAAVTGRCHPQVAILGASATGRMSYGSPELQQFPKDARPIIVDDGQGLTSVDWAQIEPVTMALMAGDREFLAPFFENDADLYEPIMRACGIDRPMAKVILLATMYGQGARSMARRIGHTEESAAQIRRQMLAAMPASRDFMAKVESIAITHGRIVTGGGRILPVDQQGSYRAVNYICQGSAYDVLAHTIVRLDEAGLSGHVQLAMHDELVVDTDVAAEVEHIMMTPPEFLTRWAKRDDFMLRTDRADMGHRWAKV